jgi:hypothetical protein
MTKKEYVSNNLGMTFDFIKHLIDHPEDIEIIPDGAELDFVDKDTPVKEGEDIKRGKIARYKVEHIFEPIKV